ncbi:MAG: 30S ribosomal protein S20 [bacterium]|nr:30S ribosomal protein S20 [bacterium]
MPVSKSAKGALIVSTRNTLQNSRIKKRVHAALKEARAVKTKKSVDAAFSVLDRAAKIHVIHVNKAARLKSRLSALLVK